MFYQAYIKIYVAKIGGAINKSTNTKTKQSTSTRNGNTVYKEKVS